jgi:hypothetical protein
MKGGGDVGLTKPKTSSGVSAMNGCLRMVRCVLISKTCMESVISKFLAPSFF